MNIRLQLDPLAITRLEAALAGEPGVFKLFYDTEGCGCNGVVTVQVIHEPEATDLEIEGRPFRFFVDRQQESQFDPVMRLEADANYPSFRLNSDAGLFSNNVRIQDIR